jgi:hypothetical protein
VLRETWKLVIEPLGANLVIGGWSLVGDSRQHAAGCPIPGESRKLTGPRMIKTSLLILTIVGLGVSVSNAEVFTHLTGEGGMVDYDYLKDEGNGWYSEPATAYRFKLGFKQAERKSPRPKLVATLEPTTSENFAGQSAVRLRIIANEEIKSLKAAYKVDLSVVKPGDAFSPQVAVAKDWYHAFALKIEASDYRLPSGPDEELTFEQWWQGSPFRPPVSLVILNENDSRHQGWSDASSKGNFALVLRDDDHNAWESGPGAPRHYDLGPVATGNWLRWVVHVRPSPTNKEGAVTVFVNGTEKLKLTGIMVGYAPARYVTKPRPGASIAYVGCCVYRLNGPNTQTFYFDEIKFADSLADVLTP